MSEGGEKRKVRQPYPGLRPFAQGEAELFFGRSREINRMLGRLEENRFLAVVGGSGSGKSSLVRAGLLPALREGYLLGAGTDWRIVVMRPGGDPFGNLATAFQEAVVGDGEEPDLGDIAFTQASLQASPLGFLEAVEEADLEEEKPLLLLVDQFEEIFRFRRRHAGGGKAERGIQGERNDAAAFVNLLLVTVKRALENGLPIYVVVTMRSEFIGDCEVFPHLPQAVSDSQFLVPRMARSQIRDVIEKPLLLFDCEASPDLVGKILNDVGTDPDQLPLMQHALMRTWSAARGRWDKEAGEKVLTPDDYREVGGFSDALSQHLEEAWGQLGGEGDRKIARCLFLCLCERAGAGAVVRRMVKLGEVAAVAQAEPDEVAAVVRVFQDEGRNFIVASPSGKIGVETILDISHEALLRQWSRLRSWFEEEEEAVVEYLRLADSARRWKDGDAELLQGRELERADDWRRVHRPTAAWAERYQSGFSDSLDYLTKSHEAAVDKARRERNTRLTLRICAIAVILILTMITVWAQREKRKAEALLQLARSRQIAFSSETVEKADGMLSMLLAVEAVKTAPTPEAIKKLYDALPRTHERLALLHPETVRYAAWNAEGDRILTYCTDGKARLWKYSIVKEQPAVERLTAELLGTSSIAVADARWNPRGEAVEVSYDEDKDSVSWLDETGEALVDCEIVRVPDRAGTGVGAGKVAWPDGLARLDGVVEESIAEMEGDQVPLQFIRGHLEPVTGISVFNPSDPGEMNLVLTVSEDNTARVWTVNGNEKAVLAGHSGSVLHGAWHPKGKHVITASKDTTVRVWEVGVLLDDRKRRPVDPGEQPAFTSWGPGGGSVLLSSAEDGSVKVFPNLDEKPEAFVRLIGVEGGIGSVEWDPEAASSGSSRLVIIAEDQTARVWDIPGRSATAQGADLAPALVLPGKPRFAGWNTSGGLVLMGEEGGELVLRLYEDLGGEPKEFTLPVDESWKPMFASWNAELELVLLADDDGDVRLFAASGNAKASVRLVGHQEDILDVDWHPGRLADEPAKLLTTSFDNTARVWHLPAELSDGEMEPIEADLVLTGHLTSVTKGRWKPHSNEDPDLIESEEPRILTLGEGGTLGLWNALGQSVSMLGTQSDKVRDASWMKDGNLRVVHRDGSSRVWPSTVSKLLEIAEQRKSDDVRVNEDGSSEELSRVLSEEERRLYLDVKR